MDVREKLVELLDDIQRCGEDFTDYEIYGMRLPDTVSNEDVADHLIANGVTVQECGEWVHPKGYVVSNGFLCSKCGHEQLSYRPINPRSGGVCIADENGNFFYPPELKYCPNCGAKMLPQPPKGE
jgi:DNA-directed RNA polymerase subunit M/transcription elongation factor TFIIS